MGTSLHWAPRGNGVQVKARARLPDSMTAGSPSPAVKYTVQCLLGKVMRERVRMLGIWRVLNKYDLLLNVNCFTCTTQRYGAVIAHILEMGRLWLRDEKLGQSLPSLPSGGARLIQGLSSSTLLRASLDLK